MSVRSLIGKIPYMAVCQDPDRFADRNLMLFDLEVANPDSVFAYRKSDAKLNRLAVLEIPAEYIGDPRLYRVAMDRVKISMHSQDKDKGRISPEQQEELDKLIEDQTANDEPKVSKELTVEDAVKGVWR